MKSLPDCRLYTFVDTAYLHGRKPVEIVHQLCDGGTDLIQLRAKNASLAETLQLAEAVLPFCRRAGVSFVLNDHPKLALQLGADFCHLGQEDFFTAGFTTAAQVTGCPKQMRLGLSTHASTQAERAIATGADYIAIGPIFATPTKPGRLGVTLDYVRWASENVRIPWFAIGGITLENLDSVLAAGARRVCVVSAILNSPDVAATCRQFKERLLSAR